ncbi:GNAT family N-acetyltransferase [Geobacter pickeringii]|uniref:N-acetyltransferase domain-containing protein n=1 Tax=Geobacter pickeringii TaxID=345632 RepID=A0A0B5BG84_9BACT|nr:GNAT family N-acetyltransferase [Geobacter pickeringii]AJE04149.1 hypothetical protein GPICK_12980 [Geobacter pickeringii]
MTLRPFSAKDLPAFLARSEDEGWLCDRWEFDFLRGAFPGGCFTLEEEGAAVAFVTSIRYGTSGWIGNLLVDRARRGRGCGTLLMHRTVEALAAAGVKTTWLTASSSGRPLYERMGFREADRVVRWVGTGRGGTGGGGPVRPAAMEAFDRAGWGDDRRTLLAAVAARGTVVLRPEGFLVVQPFGDGFQVGPWGCSAGDGAAELLDEARAVAGAGTRLFLDVPAGNGAVTALLGAAGFVASGETALMYAGAEPAYVPSRVGALASMGSMG